MANNDGAPLNKSRADIKMNELSPEELTKALNEYGLGELAERMGALIKLLEQCQCREIVNL
jgi:hypothetical protein